MELSHEVVALACIVVKTCPAQMTIREYCAMLARYGVKGTRATTKKEQHMHVDATKYFKDLSKQKQSENDELRNRLGRYEAPESSQWQQFVRAVYEDIQVEGQQDDAEADDTPSILLTLLWELGQVITSRPTDHPKFMLYINYYVDHILSRMTEYVADALNEALRIHRSIATTLASQTRPSRGTLDSIQDDQQQLRDLTDASIRAIRVANKIFPSLVRMIARLHLDDGQIAFQIVHSFGSFVDLMAAVAEASRSNVSGSSQSGRDLRNATKLIGEELLSMLGTVLRSLDPDAIAHRHMLEGILHHLFDRLGPIMHEVNFGIADQPDARQVLAEMPGLPDKEIELELQTSLHPKIIWLMPLVREALQRAPAFMDNPPSRSQSQRQTKVVKSRFSDKTRSKLQATLLKAIFQDSGAHLGYLDSLLVPQPGARSQIRPARVKATTARDWLNEEMWKLVGWEILTGENGGVEKEGKVVQGRGTVASSPVVNNRSPVNQQSQK